MLKRLSSITAASALAFLCLAGAPSLAPADPCMMVYPDSPCTYHYDPTEYFTVGPGHLLYDPEFDRGGVVLIESGTHEIAYNVYQAPELDGFEMDPENHGFFTLGRDLNIIIDGFSHVPTIYRNVIVVFDRFEPSWCRPSFFVNGNPVLYLEGLGWFCPIGDLVVSTPTLWGHNYSDTMTLDITWEDCIGVRMFAFSDENYNFHKDGGECFSAFSHDTTVPTQSSTWGAIKALYAH
jgi:hypothetical protein